MKRQAFVSTIGSTAVLCLIVAAGCAHEPAAKKAAAPDVAPPATLASSTQPAATVQLSARDIRPMYRELLAIDLPTLARVAVAKNIDIQQAHERVENSRGHYEASIQALLPVVA